jgi:hypothetical protein
MVEKNYYSDLKHTIDQSQVTNSQLHDFLEAKN